MCSSARYSKSIARYLASKNLITKAVLNQIISDRPDETFDIGNLVAYELEGFDLM